MTVFAEAALGYANRGWPLFPLKPGDKIPLLSKDDGGNGVHDATTDPDRIREWWGRCPTANIGLACGTVHWVTDADFYGFLSDEPDGADTITALVDRYGPLPRTPKQLTGGLGWQYFFKADPRIKNGVKLLPGIDTRSAGGYVAAPPSIRPSGHPYRWIVEPDEVEIAAAPEWLVALLEPVELPEPAAPPRPARTGDLTRYAAAAVGKAGERVAAAMVGSQCDTLEHEAYGLGRLVGGGVIPRAEAKAELVAAGLRMTSAAGRTRYGKPYKPWTRREIEWRVDRALAAGEARPRTPEARP